MKFAAFSAALLISLCLIKYDFSIGTLSLVVIQLVFFMQLIRVEHGSKLSGLSYLPLLLRDTRRADTLNAYNVKMAAYTRRCFRGCTLYALLLLVVAAFILSGQNPANLHQMILSGLFTAGLLLTLVNAMLIGAAQKHALICSLLAFAAFSALLLHAYFYSEACLVIADYPPFKGLGIAKATEVLTCHDTGVRLNLFRLLLFSGGFAASCALLIAGILVCYRAFMLQAKSLPMLTLLLAASLALLLSPASDLVAFLLILYVAFAGFLLGPLLLRRQRA